MNNGARTTVYSLGNKTKLDELQVLQNGCIKALFRWPKRTSSTYLYSSSILPVCLLATVDRVTHLHKMIKRTTKHGFNIRLNCEFNNRASRRRSHVSLAQEHPTLQQAINEYNRLSSEMRQCDNIEHFKSRVKLKIISESDKYVAISPFRYVN